MAYITAENLRDYIGASSHADDTQLGYMCTRAQSMVESFCNRKFEATANTTRYYNALDISYGGVVDAFNNTLLLDEDLAQLVSIVNGDGNSIPLNAVVTLPANMSPSYGIKIKMNTQYVWTYVGEPDTAIAITGRFAYSVTPPQDIIAATLRLGAYIYRQREGTPDTDRSIISPDGMILAAAKIPTDVLVTLDPYRRRT
jgi:hypothetical protein